MKVLRELRVELGSVEDAEGDDVEPEEQSDACAEGAVDLRIVGESGDVPTEGQGGEKPDDRGGDGSGKNTLPGLTDGRSHVIEECDDANTAGESDGPAEEQSDEVDRGASRWNDMQGEPEGDEVSKDDE